MAVWIGTFLVFVVALIIAYGCGYENGRRDGVLWIKLDAIRVGAAKACSFDGGWRWLTKDELADQRALANPQRDGDAG